MRDSRARSAVRWAVRDVFGFLGGGGAGSGRLDNRSADKQRRGRDPVIRNAGAAREVALSVTCGAGTHRSVAVVEVIARELRAMGKGVEIKVCHVHRLKMGKDPD